MDEYDENIDNKVTTCRNKEECIPTNSNKREMRPTNLGISSILNNKKKNYSLPGKFRLACDLELIQALLNTVQSLFINWIELVLTR